MHRRILATLAVSALALTAAACTNDEATPTSPAPPPAATAPATEAPGAMPTPTPAEGATPGGDATPNERNATALRAIATAAQAAGGTAYELDDADDDGQWEIDVMVGDRNHEVTVAADGQTVVSREEDDADTEDRNRLQQAQTTIEQAIEAALMEVPGNLDDVELDDDNGRTVWEVTVDEQNMQDVEVYVDVVTGDVVRADR